MRSATAKASTDKIPCHDSAVSLSVLVLRPQGNPFGICGGQSGIGTDFYSRQSTFRQCYYSRNVMYNLLEATVHKYILSLNYQKKEIYI